jgi:hypothetical protein
MRKTDGRPYTAVSIIFKESQVQLDSPSTGYQKYSKFNFIV